MWCPAPSEMRGPIPLGAGAMDSDESGVEDIASQAPTEEEDGPIMVTLWPAHSGDSRGVISAIRADDSRQPVDLTDARYWSPAPISHWERWTLEDLLALLQRRHSLPEYVSKLLQKPSWGYERVCNVIDRG